MVLSLPRDPHQLPPTNGHYGSSDPVIYLPPLLSSLPDTLTSSAEHSDTQRLPRGSVDPASLALHKALHDFQPVTRQYAEVPYGKAFNWDQLDMDDALEREW